MRAREADSESITKFVPGDQRAVQSPRFLMKRAAIIAESLAHVAEMRYSLMLEVQRSILLPSLFSCHIFYW